MKEHNIQTQILIEHANRGDTVFRNNVGAGWVSPPSRRLKATKRMTVTLEPGDVVLRNPYWVKWGLVEGASDIIGIRPTLITTELIGRTLGVFIATEVKLPNGRVREEQQRFLDHIWECGGFASVARSVEDVP